MILGLTGYARTGKDTAAGVLGMWGGWQRVAFADKLKAAAYDTNPIVLSPAANAWRLRDLVDVYGWEQAKAWPTVREYLQNLGVAMRDHIHTDVWADAALADCVDPDTDYVITDVRFPNEADAIAARGGIVVRVVRPGVDPVNAHISETALDGYDFPVVVNDDTPEVLASRVLDVCLELHL